MLTPLQEAGVHTLDEVLLRGEALPVEWTGLPPHQVTALCNYSQTLRVGKLALLEGPTSDTTTDDNMNEGEGNTENEDYKTYHRLTYSLFVLIMLHAIYPLSKPS